jgi:hypothetical protein
VAAGKSKPTYPLDEVKRLATVRDSRTLTGVAEERARTDFGIVSRDAIFAIVADLRPGEFHKTMPAEQRPGLFQDVYYTKAATPRHQSGTVIYCKVQICGGQLCVVSFKASDR